MTAGKLFARDEVVPLWPDEPPGGGGPSGPLRVNKHGSWSNIVSPTIQRFKPENPNGEAVLIAAGGLASSAARPPAGTTEPVARRDRAPH